MARMSPHGMYGDPPVLTKNLARVHYNHLLEARKSKRLNIPTNDPTDYDEVMSRIYQTIYDSYGDKGYSDFLDYAKEFDKEEAIRISKEYNFFAGLMNEIGESSDEFRKKVVTSNEPPPFQLSVTIPTNNKFYKKNKNEFDKLAKEGSKFKHKFFIKQGESIQIDMPTFFLWYQDARNQAFPNKEKLELVKFDPYEMGGDIRPGKDYSENTYQRLRHLESSYSPNGNEVARLRLKLVDGTESPNIDEIIESAPLRPSNNVFREKEQSQQEVNQPSSEDGNQPSQGVSNEFNPIIEQVVPNAEPNNPFDPTKYSEPNPNDPFANSNRAWEEAFSNREEPDQTGIGNIEYKNTPIPWSDIASGIFGLAQGASLSNQELTKRDERVSEELIRYANDYKKISELGLSPEEEAQYKNMLNETYSVGMEQIVNNSAGNRNIVLGNMGRLDAQAQVGVAQMELADMQKRMEAMDKYGQILSVINQVDLERDIANNEREFQNAQMNAQAGGALMQAGWKSIIDSIDHYKSMSPGGAMHAYLDGWQMREMGFSNLRKPGTAGSPEDYANKAKEAHSKAMNHYREIDEPAKKFTPPERKMWYDLMETGMDSDTAVKTVIETGKKKIMENALNNGWIDEEYYRNNIPLDKMPEELNWINQMNTPDASGQFGEQFNPQKISQPDTTQPSQNPFQKDEQYWREMFDQGMMYGKQNQNKTPLEVIDPLNIYRSNKKNNML